MDYFMEINLDYLKQNFFGGYKKDSFSISLSKHPEVKSCTRCNGTGTVSKEELSDYHKREYITITNDCNVCDGEGRIISSEVYVTFGSQNYNPSANYTSTRILYQTVVEPYSKEKAKQMTSDRKSFFFKEEDLNEMKAS